MLHLRCDKSFFINIWVALSDQFFVGIMIIVIYEERPNITHCYRDQISVISEERSAAKMLKTIFRFFQGIIAMHWLIIEDIAVEVDFNTNLANH